MPSSNFEMNEIMIVPWEERFKNEVVDLVLSIQQKEFLISITEADQPDLKQIDSFYQQGNGNFWIALCGNDLVGTIGLLDIGHQQLALRKMFVHKEFRGSKYGLAKRLLETAIDWSIKKNIQDIYLGTVEILKAAHRFYEKTGFEKIQKQALPLNFPIMTVDTFFYHLSISK